MYLTRKVAGAAAVLFYCSRATAAPDMVIVNAKVFTGDAARPQAEALAIEGGRITTVGNTNDIRQSAGTSTRVIDARGRLVTPGLVEAHVHLGGSNLPSPPLAMPGMPFPGPTPEQALAAVEAAAKAPGDWITALIGPAVARDQRNWRMALDAVAADRPVLLSGFWGHTTILNSAALRRLAIQEDIADPQGGWWGRDADGRLNGRASESAETNVGMRLPPQVDARVAADFREAGDRYARWGVTSIHLMNSGSSVAKALEALATAKTPQKWTIYSWAAREAQIANAWTALKAAPGVSGGRVRVEGLKWVLDGTGIEQNAMYSEPYSGRPGWRGRSNYTDDQLREIMRTALERSEQLALHVVGDGEAERVFSMMLSLAPAEVWKGKRVRIEHGDGVRADLAKNAVELGVVITQNPTHLLPAPQPGIPPLFDRLSLLRSLVTAGVPLALGSDGGESESNPFLNMMLASTYGGSPAEALTREQALLAYTSGGAYAERQERNKGQIMPGMAADLTVLSQDVLTVQPQALPATRSLLTVVDGEIIFEDPALTASQIR